MKKILVMAAILTLCATSAFAVVDTFSYGDGNLNGNGGWTGSDAGSIMVTGGKVKITSNATDYTDANLAVAINPIEGLICVSFDYQMALAAPDNYFDIYVKDSAGKYLAWMYGRPEGYWDNGGVPTFAGGEMRGRGPDGVSYNYIAQGDYAWHHYCMLINTATNYTSYYVDNVLIQVARQQDGGVGDSVATLQFRAYNKGHSGSWGYFDNLGAIGGNICVPEPGSILALLSGLVGIVGFARKRR